MSSKFKNHTEKGKYQARDLVLSHVRPGNNILTLPNTNFIFEKAALAKGVERLFCMENDIDVYNVAQPKALVTSIKINMMLGDIFTFYTHTGYQINLAWFDLCGCLTPDTEVKFLQCIKSPTFRFGNTIALTVQTNRHPSADYIADTYGVSRDEYYKHVFPEQVIAAGRSASKHVVLEERLVYTDTSTMCLYIFKSY